MTRIEENEMLLERIEKEAVDDKTTCNLDKKVRKSEDVYVWKKQG